MKPPPPELSLVVGIGSSVVSPHPERRRRSSLSTQDIAELSSLVSNTETLVAEAPSKRRPSIAPQSASAVLPPSAGSIGFDLLRPTTSEYTTAVAESVDSPSGCVLVYCIHCTCFSTICLF